GRRQRRIGDAVAVEMRHPRTGLPATERDPAVVLLGARSTKNADRGGLLALGGRICMRGRGRRGGMGGIAGMFGYGRVENGARVGIALAAKLVELGHVLLEQATLCLGRDVSFHDGDDVVPQLLARDVARKITLVSRKSACGRRGNRERRPGHLQKSDQVSAVIGTFGPPLPPCRHGTKMATLARMATAQPPTRGGAHRRACVRLARLGAAGQRRRDGGANPADCGGLAIVKFNVAGLEYQYGGGAWRRKSSSAAFIAALTLRVRELLDVALQRVELAPQAIDFLVLRGALRIPLRRGGRLQLQPQSPIRGRPGQRERTDDARTKRYSEE